MSTPKQTLAAEKLLENTRNGNPKTTGEILVEAGYSAGTAITPSQVTRSTGFIAVLERAGVTDERLSQVLEEGLQATKDNGSADNAIRHRYLETAVKLKGHLTPANSGDAPAGNTYNTFIQQNQFNPNAPESKQLINSTLDMLMGQMKEQ